MGTYTPATALVVVDCQNDFADPDGSLYVSGGEEVVAAVNGEIVKALAGGAAVFYTQDWHPETTPHFQKDGGIWPVHCVAGSWGAAFHPRLLVAGSTVRKGVGGEDGYSGFTMSDAVSGEKTPTRLEELVGATGASHIVVVGLALDYCVKATALDAVALGHPTRLVSSATAAVELSAGDGDAAASELAAAGVAID
jgi:nicotinamidase/pyrazinamidase